MALTGLGVYRVAVCLYMRGSTAQSRLRQEAVPFPHLRVHVGSCLEVTTASNAETADSGTLAMAATQGAQGGGRGSRRRLQRAKSAPGVVRRRPRCVAEERTGFCRAARRQSAGPGLARGRRSRHRSASAKSILVAFQSSRRRGRRAADLELLTPRHRRSGMPSCGDRRSAPFQGSAVLQQLIQGLGEPPVAGGIRVDLVRLQLAVAEDIGQGLVFERHIQLRGQFAIQRMGA
jgi:hypothetical protein